MADDPVVTFDALTSATSPTIEVPQAILRNWSFLGAATILKKKVVEAPSWVVGLASGALFSLVPTAFALMGSGASGPHEVVQATAPVVETPVEEQADEEPPVSSAPIEDAGPAPDVQEQIPVSIPVATDGGIDPWDPALRDEVSWSAQQPSSSERMATQALLGGFLRGIEQAPGISWNEPGDERNEEKLERLRRMKEAFRAQDRSGCPTGVVYLHEQAVRACEFMHEAARIRSEHGLGSVSVERFESLEAGWEEAAGKYYDLSAELLEEELSGGSKLLALFHFGKS